MAEYEETILILEECINDGRRAIENIDAVVALTGHPTSNTTADKEASAARIVQLEKAIKLLRSA